MPQMRGTGPQRGMPWKVSQKHVLVLYYCADCTTLRLILQVLDIIVYALYSYLTLKPKLSTQRSCTHNTMNNPINGDINQNHRHMTWNAKRD